MGKSKSKSKYTKSDSSLFEIDTTGSSSVRHELIVNASKVAGAAPTSKNRKLSASEKKPFSFDRILAERSGEAPLVGKTQKQYKPKTHVSREEKERLRRIVGKDGQGEGLWGIKGETTGNTDAVVQRIKNFTPEDIWTQKSEPMQVDSFDLSAIHNPEKFHSSVKTPKLLHKHDLLSKTDEKRPNISLPHAGTSYNPTYQDHQNLLAEALEFHTVMEEREERGRELKEALEAQRKINRKEEWEYYQEEIGSGESENEEEETPSVPLVKKQPKRKTKTQRNKHQREMDRQLAHRRAKALRLRTHATINAPSIISEIDQQKNASLEAKALAFRLQKVRLAKQGLTGYRSGPGRVPQEQPTFQLGEDLADSLRTLKTEGNLWRDFVGRGMRNGKIVVGRDAFMGTRGGKGGRGKEKGNKLKERTNWAYRHDNVGL